MQQGIYLLDPLASSGMPCRLLINLWQLTLFRRRLSCPALLPSLLQCQHCNLLAACSIATCCRVPTPPLPTVQH